MSTAVGVTSPAVNNQPQYIEEPLQPGPQGDDAKVKDLAKIKQLLEEGGVLSNAEFQLLLDEVLASGEILSDDEFKSLLDDIDKQSIEANLSADDLELLNKFTTLAKEIHEANNNKNTSTMQASISEDDAISSWNNYANEKRSEIPAQGGSLKTGDSVIDSFTSVQMLVLYTNMLMINMSNESAATLTVMQKLFEKVTDKLSQLQSFLSKVNAFYKEALADRLNKSKEVEQDNPVEGQELSTQMIDWNSEDLRQYREKNGHIFPPTEPPEAGKKAFEEGAQIQLNNELYEKNKAAFANSWMGKQMNGLLAGFVEMGTRPVSQVTGRLESRKFETPGETIRFKAPFNGANGEYRSTYSMLVPEGFSYSHTVTEKGQDYDVYVGQPEIHYGIPEDTIYFRADDVPDLLRQYTSKVTYNGEDYYAINPEVMDKALQEVSMLISMLLPKEDSGSYGQFYDLNKANMLNNITLDTIINECTNKMKLISDLATKMNEQLRQLQNAIENSKQQFDSSQSMFTQQQNKM